jgi:hypothetical protein
MHISKMFTPRPYDEFKTSLSPGYKDGHIEALWAAIFMIIGLMFLPVIRGMSASVLFWVWILPSLIMTPFTIWRIIIRIRKLPETMAIGSFIWEDFWLDKLTGWKIVLYLLKAYMPLVNWVCIIAGITALFTKELHVR